jgi:hypothetical protein
VREQQLALSLCLDCALRQRASAILLLHPVRRVTYDDLLVRERAQVRHVTLDVRPAREVREQGKVNEAIVTAVVRTLAGALVHLWSPSRQHLLKRRLAIERLIRRGARARVCT